MPGLTAPSDYAEEPPRHPALKINSKVSATPPSLHATPPAWRFESDWVGALRCRQSRGFVRDSGLSRPGPGRLDACEGFYGAGALADQAAADSPLVLCSSGYHSAARMRQACKVLLLRNG